jgi:hypothetical protein
MTDLHLLAVTELPPANLSDPDAFTDEQLLAQLATIRRANDAALERSRQLLDARVQILAEARNRRATMPTKLLEEACGASYPALKQQVDRFLATRT